MRHKFCCGCTRPDRYPICTSHFCLCAAGKEGSRGWSSDVGEHSERERTNIWV